MRRVLLRFLAKTTLPVLTAGKLRNDNRWRTSIRNFRWTFTVAGSPIPSVIRAQRRNDLLSLVSIPVVYGGQAHNLPFHGIGGVLRMEAPLPSISRLEIASHLSTSLIVDVDQIFAIEQVRFKS